MGITTLSLKTFTTRSMASFILNRTQKNKIIGWMNRLHKDTSSIIRHNASFFCSLSGIMHVVVIGHSVNEVDWSYFYEVNKSVGSNALWHFHYHSSDDKKWIEAYIAHSGIANFRII